MEVTNGPVKRSQNSWSHWVQAWEVRNLWLVSSVLNLSDRVAALSSYRFSLFLNKVASRKRPKTRLSCDCTFTIRKCAFALISIASICFDHDRWNNGAHGLCVQYCVGWLLLPDLEELVIAVGIIAVSLFALWHALCPFSFVENVTCHECILISLCWDEVTSYQTREG